MCTSQACISGAHRLSAEMVYLRNLHAHRKAFVDQQSALALRSVHSPPAVLHASNATHNRAGALSERRADRTGCTAGIAPAGHQAVRQMEAVNMAEGAARRCALLAIHLAGAIGVYQVKDGAQLARMREAAPQQALARPGPRLLYLLHGCK